MIASQSSVKPKELHPELTIVWLSQAASNKPLIVVICGL